MQQSVKRPVTLLIDADVIAYEFANVAQDVIDWGDGEEPAVSMLPIEDVTPGIKQRIEHLQDRCNGDDVILCLTPSPDVNNFRKKLLPTYKANRGIKPLLLPAVREWMQANYRTYLRDGLEGDDCMGILSTHPTLIPGTKIIVSIDKDMKSIPGLLFNPKHDTLLRVSQTDADHWHMYQTLVGDSTDNYKGCPDIGTCEGRRRFSSGLPARGMKYARRVLSAARGSAIVDAFVAKGLTEEDALVQARVARILRHTDYDFKRKEPILWQPEK
jgi:DNA polymerase-1